MNPVATSGVRSAVARTVADRTLFMVGAGDLARPGEAFADSGRASGSAPGRSGP